MFPSTSNTSYTQYTQPLPPNETITQITQQPQQEQIQYVPVTREEKIVYQQEPQQVVVQKEEPAKPTSKPADTKKTSGKEGLFSAPSIVPIPGRNIADIVSGMQKVGKPGEQLNQADTGGAQPKGTETTGQKESLGEQLARLQRGGGRTANAKDMLDELPPQDSQKSEESDEPEDPDKKPENP